MACCQKVEGVEKAERAEKVERAEKAEKVKKIRSGKRPPLKDKSLSLSAYP